MMEKHTLAQSESTSSCIPQAAATFSAASLIASFLVLAVPTKVCCWSTTQLIQKLVLYLDDQNRQELLTD